MKNVLLSKLVLRHGLRNERYNGVQSFDVNGKPTNVFDTKLLAPAKYATMVLQSCGIISVISNTWNLYNERMRIINCTNSLMCVSIT